MGLLQFRILLNMKYISANNVLTAIVLTENAEHHHHEVEYVPRLFEVVPTQSYDLQKAFDREHRNENGVNERQSFLKLGCLSVVLESHGDHIHHDHRHYGDIEFLVRSQPEEE